MKVHRYEESEETVRSITSPSIFLAGPTVSGINYCKETYK